MTNDEGFTFLSVKEERAKERSWNPRYRTVSVVLKLEECRTC